MTTALKLGPLRREASKRYDFLFLIAAYFVFFLLRLPSLFEPHWYGDEGIYQVIGEALNRGSLLYRDIWDNKPPFLYLLYALFNSDQFTLRLVSLVSGFLSIVIFFFLSKRLFPHYFLTTSIFTLLLGLPIIEGNIANAENFMMPLILMAALLIFPREREIFLHETNFPAEQDLASRDKLLLAGFLLGFAFLFKVVAVFDFLAFFTFLIVVSLTQKNKLYLRTFSLSLGFLIPIVITAFYFWTQGAFADFFRASFMSNISYVAWENELIFPQGLLFLKTALLIIAIAYIVVKRRFFSLSAVFILLWFVFSLYNAFFSQRPYTHYLLMLLPSFSLILGLIFWEKKHRSVIALFFVLAFVLVIKNFNPYYKIIDYYQNFTSYVSSGKSAVSYREFFDKRTPIDYEIASFIKSKIRKQDSIFIWGDNAQVYKMVGVTPPGKYIASYHVTSNKDGIDNVRDAIDSEKPRFVVIMPDQSPLPFQLTRYFERIIIGRVSIYESFF